MSQDEAYIGLSRPVYPLHLMWVLAQLNGLIDMYDAYTRVPGNHARRSLWNDP